MCTASPPGGALAVRGGPERGGPRCRSSRSWGNSRVGPQRTQERAPTPAESHRRPNRVDAGAPAQRWTRPPARARARRRGRGRRRRRSPDPARANRHGAGGRCGGKSAAGTGVDRGGYGRGAGAEPHRPGSVAAGARARPSGGSTGSGPCRPLTRSTPLSRPLRHPVRTWPSRARHPPPSRSAPHPSSTVPTRRPTGVRRPPPPSRPASRPTPTRQAPPADPSPAHTTPEPASLASDPASTPAIPSPAHTTEPASLAPDADPASTPADPSPAHTTPEPVGLVPDADRVDPAPARSPAAVTPEPGPGQPTPPVPGPAPVPTPSPPEPRPIPAPEPGDPIPPAPLPDPGTPGPGPRPIPDPNLPIPSPPGPTPQPPHPVPEPGHPVPPTEPGPGPLITPAGGSRRRHRAPRTIRCPDRRPDPVRARWHRPAGPSRCPRPRPGRRPRPRSRRRRRRPTTRRRWPVPSRTRPGGAGSTPRAPSTCAPPTASGWSAPGRPARPTRGWRTSPAGSTTCSPRSSCSPPG